MDRSDRSPGRVAVVMLMAVAFATLLVSSAIAGSPPKGRFGVGDSIMLSAKPELRPLGYGVNASVGRQFGAGVWIVRHKAEDGTLPKRVIVHLGTNGTIDPGDCDRLVGYAGPKRRVFLMTITVPRAWEEPNNETLNACANAHDKVHVIRWWSKSPRPPRVVRRRRLPPQRRGTRGLRPLRRSEGRRRAGRASRAGRSLDSSRWPARAAEGTRLESV